jgi:hypothetical protein
MISIAPAAPISVAPTSLGADTKGHATERGPSVHGSLATRLGATAGSEPVTRPTFPTLPPGVLFIEEPSGIKIYVNNSQVQGTASAHEERTGHGVDFDATPVEND